MSEQPIRTERSFCRVCTSLCGILVDKQGEEVVRVRGDRDHPVSAGYTCPKGRALTRMHHHPDRIEQPHIKRDGTLQPASWDEALDDLAHRLRRIIDEHGPAAVGIYFGSGVGMDAAGYHLSGLLHGAIGTPAKFSPLTIDGTAKVLVASQVGGFPGLNGRPDYDNVELVVYIGVHPVVSHGHAVAMPIPPTKTIRAVADRGEVWVIDPRRTETAGFASRHLAPRPGTDYAVLAYLVREVLADGADPEVLQRRALDVDELRRAVAPFTRSAAARIAGVDETELDDLLAAVRRAGRLAVDTGTGVTMSTEANLTQWLAWALMIITDSMNRPGGLWFHPGFLSPMDAAPVPEVPPEALFSPGPKSRPELQGFIGEWPCAALPDEIEAGNIRAFLNLGGNLVTAFPDENRLRPALEQLDVFLSLDIIANETAALSTHVLPTKDQLERPDVTLWDFLSSRVDAQYTPALAEPVGERRSTWWMLAELMRRMGYETPDYLPEDDRDGADDQVLAAAYGQGRCRFSDLAENRYLARERQLPAPWVEEHLDKIGGWRLAPRLLVDQLAELSRPHLAGEGDALSLRLVPRRQKRHVNAQFTYLGDRAEILLHPEDAATVNVADGAAVAISTGRGEILGIARVDDSVRRGVVSVPHGYEEANVNLLTDAGEADPITGMAHYSGFNVRVSQAG